MTSKRPDVVRIFIAPPSWAELERRLKERGTDSDEKIEKRLLRAKVEFQTAHTYDYFVINDTVDNAVRELSCHHDRRALQAQGGAWRSSAAGKTASFVNFKPTGR